MNDQQPNLPERPENDYPITGKDVFVVVVSTLMILVIGFVALSVIGTVELVGDEGGLDMEQVDEWASGNLESLPISMKAAMMVVQMLLIVPAWVYIRRKRLSPAVYLRVRPVPLSLVFYSLVIGVSVAVVGDEISRLMEYVLPLPDSFAANIQRMMELHSFADFVTMGLTVALIAPIVEEMLFRGFFQRYFEAKRGVTSGVLIASALFAGYHFNIYWLIPILLMATIMGAMAWRADSIVPTVIVHLTNNSLGLAAANIYGSEEPGWFVRGAHVNPLILVVSVVLLIWGLRQYFRAAEAHRSGGGPPDGRPGTSVDMTA